MLKVVTAEEMRSIEAEAVHRGTTLHDLMERAGEAVAERARDMAAGRPILILAGPGNNGGDGIVAARHLARDGLAVAVYTFRRPDTADFEGQVKRAEDDATQQDLAALVEKSGVVVDALLGIGQSRPPEGLLAAILDCVNSKRSDDTLALAVDIPTGVNADTGAVPGVAFRADITLAMAFPKCGDIVYPGADLAGRTIVADVGIPVALAHDVSVWLPADEDIAARLPPRSLDANKGSNGRLLIVAGSRNFVGAPALCALAGYRIGAGLTDVATIEHVQQSVAANAMEPVYTLLPAVDGKIAPSALPAIAASLGHARALVMGPGLGLADTTAELVTGILGLPERGPLRGSLVDADGLNALAQVPDWWEDRKQLVLTPHPGEMARLCDMSIEQIQADRLGVARRFAQQWGNVVVLKGAGTIIASPDGEVAINPTGGPNLATAGTGDVLSGTIGGLIAQGCDCWDAAVVGTYLHGRAGDIIARRLGPAGTLAGDLPGALPLARQSLFHPNQEFE